MHESSNPSNQPAPNSKKVRHKKALVVVASVIALMSVGAGAYYLMQPKVENADNKSVSDSDGTDSKGTDFIQEVSEITQTQGNDAAQEKIDKEISQAKTAEQKADLYSLKAATVSASGDDSAAGLALEYFYKADEVYPSFSSALNIADLEYAAGNKTVALKYYELYMTRSTAEDGSSLDPTGKKFYEQRIQELKS